MLSHVNLCAALASDGDTRNGNTILKTLVREHPGVSRVLTQTWDCTCLRGGLLRSFVMLLTLLTVEPLNWWLN